MVWSEWLAGGVFLPTPCSDGAWSDWRGADRLKGNSQILSGWAHASLPTFLVGVLLSAAQIPLPPGSLDQPCVPCILPRVFITAQSPPMTVMKQGLKTPHLRVSGETLCHLEFTCEPQWTRSSIFGICSLVNAPDLMLSFVITAQSGSINSCLSVTSLRNEVIVSHVPCHHADHDC